MFGSVSSLIIRADASKSEEKREALSGDQSPQRGHRERCPGLPGRDRVTRRQYALSDRKERMREERIML